MYKDVDYYALGKRIRTARMNKYLTQSEGKRRKIQ